MKSWFQTWHFIDLFAESQQAQEFCLSQAIIHGERNTNCLWMGWTTFRSSSLRSKAFVS
ncbi:hypothetical protein RchiOBHm_Chr1g0316811 [Rosa chinensis]|uniref:Uncharacterized protein n=1 Tax=Rosa chinensis TaxID=74649 RepID=A0A2P6S7P9_ROSCH|nr:hypothetical protein RchiOBHm_Chr1g0316811 [Rosa chinensis]